MLISQSLVELVEKNANDLARQWLADVRRNRNTPFYHTFPGDRLFDRAFEMYKHLSRFLSDKTAKEETEKFYRKYGQDRCRENFPLPELIYSFILFRRHLWLYILHVGFLDTAYELLKAMELNNRVILFFDRALVSMVKGHEEASQTIAHKAA